MASWLVQVEQPGSRRVATLARSRCSAGSVLILYSATKASAWGVDNGLRDDALGFSAVMIETWAAAILPVARSAISMHRAQWPN